MAVKHNLSEHIHGGYPHGWRLQCGRTIVLRNREISQYKMRFFGVCSNLGHRYVYVRVFIRCCVEATLDVDSADAQDFADLGSIEIRFHHAPETGVGGFYETLPFWD